MAAEAPHITGQAIIDAEDQVRNYLVEHGLGVCEKALDHKGDSAVLPISDLKLVGLSGDTKIEGVGSFETNSALVVCSDHQQELASDMGLKDKLILVFPLEKGFSDFRIPLPFLAQKFRR